MPTYASDPNGVSMTMADVEPALLEAPVICIDDFHLALTKAKPTVAQSDLKKYEDWTEEFGIEG